MHRAALAVLALLVATPAFALETFATPEAALESLYAGYTTEPSPDTEIPDSQEYFSDHLKGLYDAANAKADGVGALDFDPVVAGQDWTLSKLDVGKAKIEGDTAHSTVRFQNFDAPQTLDYTLVREHGGWRIDDIRSLAKGEEWTLSDILKSE